MCRVHKHTALTYYLDESEEDEAAPPLSKRRRAAERAAEGREPIEEVNIILSADVITRIVSHTGTRVDREFRGH